jgi:hypothetical protein
MRRLVVKLAIFVLLALVVIELSLHATLGRKSAWYTAAAQIVNVTPVDYIFVGSSRVAASIDEKYFERAIKHRLGRDVKALNMGMGYCSLADHYFGLRTLLRLNPRNLKGVTVLIEAPSGLPFSETWRDRWLIRGGSPDLFVPYVGFSDLLTFWRLSSDDLTEKLYMTASKYLMTIRKGGAIRNRTMMDGDGVTRTLLEKARLASRSQTSIDLTSAGGIQTDENQIRFVREAAVQNSENEMREQHAIRSWDQSVLRSIVDLVTASGGTVVLFDTPLNSLQLKPLNTELRKSDRQFFEKVADRWGIPILRPQFKTVDSDYPDSWHLRRSLSAAYTNAVAATYIDYLDRMPYSLRAER